MIEITKKKKIFLIILGALIILSFASLTYAYFTAASITGNVTNSNVTTLTSDYGLITVRYLNDNVINSESVMLVEDGSDYEEILKFSVQNEGTAAQDIIIHWEDLTNDFCKYQAGGSCTNINTDNDVRNELNYTFYECDNVTSYTAATIEDMSGCTTPLSNLNTTVPPTGSISNIHTANKISIAESTTKYYVFKLTIENLDVPQNYNQGKEMTGKIIVDYSTIRELANTVQRKYTAQSDTGINFGNVSSDANGKGLYINNKVNIASDPTLGKVKYFRGNVDNYVMFADILWRVIRIDEKGNVRLITNSTIGTGNAYATGITDKKYVGYTYDRIEGNIGTSSAIKTVVDAWYSDNLSTYNTFINQNAVFCNDTSGTYSEYGPGLRNVSAKTPTFSCPAPSYNYGGIYQLPVGIITADEVAYAGGMWNTASSYYLNNGTSSWTISPCESYSDYAGMYYITFTGILGSNDGEAIDVGYRPVIELNKTAHVSDGDGTSTSPWIIE